MNIAEALGWPEAFAIASLVFGGAFAFVGMVACIEFSAAWKERGK